MTPFQTIRHNAGFSLVEMAVALTILGLLIALSIGPYSAQRDLRDISDTRDKLRDITDALYGFAVLNGRLPCPTTQADPASASYGMEDGTCSAGYAAEGYLPWRTLGLPEIDAWGSRRTQASDGWNGYWRYRVERIYATTTGFSANILNTSMASYIDKLVVRDEVGNALTTTADYPLAVIYSTAKNGTADGLNSTYEATNGEYQSAVENAGFDDIVTWLNRPLMVNKLITANKLP